MVHRRERPLRQLGARLPLAGMHRRLHPVELGEDVVGQVERAVGEHVALVPRRTRNGATSSVRRGDLLALAAHVVCVEPRHDADVRVWSQIAM